MTAFAAPPGGLAWRSTRPAAAGTRTAPSRLPASCPRSRAAVAPPPTAVLASPRAAPAEAPAAASSLADPTPTSAAAAVTALDSAEELVAALSADVATPGAPEAVSVVKFHAPYCRSCAGVRVKYERMAAAYAAAAAEDAAEPAGEDASSAPAQPLPVAVSCYEMDFSRHGELCTRLGVDRLPYFMVIRGGRRLFGEAVAWNRFSEVRAAVDEAVHAETPAAGGVAAAEAAPAGGVVRAALAADAA